MRALVTFTDVPNDESGWMETNISWQQGKDKGIRRTRERNELKDPEEALESKYIRNPKDIAFYWLHLL